MHTYYWFPAKLEAVSTETEGIFRKTEDAVFGCGYAHIANLKKMLLCASSSLGNTIF